MSRNDLDPGGGRTNLPPPSYANRVKNMRYQKLNRNVLEIIAEENIESQHVNLNGEQVASVCEIIGVQVGQDTEGYQTHYRGQYITL